MHYKLDAPEAANVKYLDLVGTYSYPSGHYFGVISHSASAGGLTWLYDPYVGMNLWWERVVDQAPPQVLPYPEADQSGIGYVASHRFESDAATVTEEDAKRVLGMLMDIPFPGP